MNRIDELDLIPFRKGQRSVVVKVFEWWLDNTASQLRVRQRFLAWLREQYGFEAKRCSRCRCWRPLDSFGECKTAKDGRYWSCLKCDRAYKADNSRKQYRDDPDVRARKRFRDQKKWALLVSDPQRHAEQLAHRREYYAANRERILELARARYTKKTRFEERARDAT